MSDTWDAHQCAVNSEVGNGIARHRNGTGRGDEQTYGKGSIQQGREWQGMNLRDYNGDKDQAGYARECMNTS